MLNFILIVYNQQTSQRHLNRQKSIPKLPTICSVKRNVTLLERLVYKRISHIILETTPVEQAGFHSGRSCTNQVLVLTTYIEIGFQEQLKTAVAFIHLTVAYDTVWKQGLLSLKNSGKYQRFSTPNKC